MLDSLSRTEPCMAYKSPNPNVTNGLRPSRASSDPLRPVKARRGRPAIDNAALLSPTIGDIREAAGFYEGEGHFRLTTGEKELVDIGQNDREKLDWLQIRFGGKVYGPYIGNTGNDIYFWKLVRERAAGFMYTIFTFLSKSRREQFIYAMLGKPSSSREYQKSISDEGISEAFVKRNIENSLKRQGKTVKGAMRLFGVKK